MTGRSRGLALVNALVIVMAISSVAVGVLVLAGKGRARVHDTIVTNQLVLYLDGIQALIPLLLEQEWEKNGVDHLDEFWATQGYSVPIDRGQAQATVTDLQGLLDVNRLAAADAATLAEFTRLFDSLALSRSQLAGMVAFLSDAGPTQISDYLNRDVPILPAGGAITIIDELRQVEGMDDASFDRLAPYITALPEPAPLNVNTAPTMVLQAVMPLLRSDQIAALQAERAIRPFETNLDFLVRADQLLGEGMMDGIALDRITARTSHFAALLGARLDGRQLARQVLFSRDDASGKTTVRFASAVPAFDGDP